MHTFSGLCAIGAALGRRVFFRMGHFSIYPNYAAILIGPPGIKKTTAGDIALKLVKQTALCPIMPDKVPPERMVSILKECGHQYVYMAEFSVFFGRQRYNEGLTTQILRMLDSPDEFMVSTQARSDEVIIAPTITMLGCTTPSLLASSTPTEVSSSGFLSRLVLVFERVDSRVFHVPEVGPGEGKLLDTLNRLKSWAGKMSFEPNADRWHEAWYIDNKKKLRETEDETTAEVRARANNHLLRTAMLMHLVQCDTPYICLQCLETSAKLMGFVEASAPQIMRSIKQSAVSVDSDYMVQILTRLGGAADHSTLLRRVASRMNAQQFKAHVRTLEESGLLKVTKRGIATYYILTGASNDAE